VVLAPSTADAARAVRDGEYDAAISAPIAADHYGLQVLANDIHDNEGAVTRFVLVSRPSAPPAPTGADRTTLVVMVDAYHEDDVEGEKRVVLRLHPAIAPLKAAVFPLVNKDGMPELARRIFDDLRKHYNTFYDDGGSIGRRYRRQDEAGTPFGITIDGQSTQDGTVTVRDRDTLKQDRVAADRLPAYLGEKLKA
jgi:glycyl-tRNA synthetase